MPPRWRPLKSALRLDDAAGVNVASEPAVCSAAGGQQQGGFVLFVVLIAIVVPVLLLAIGAADIALTDGQSQQATTVATAQARSAAEAGLGDALFLARSEPGLVAGSTSNRAFGDGRAYAMTASMAGGNLRVTVTGTWGTTSRVLQMDLEPVATTPQAPPASSLTMLDKNATFQLTGSTVVVDGHDHLIDGSAGNAADDKPGMVVEPPGTTADLLNMVAAGARSRITGVGSAPSFGVAASTTDLAAMRTTVQAVATVTLTKNSYSGASFGDATTGDYRVSYRAGDVTFAGASRGAGVLFVTGNLTVKGTFRFDGIIYVQGDFDAQANATIEGAVVGGTAGHHVNLQGHASLLHAAAAVTRGAAAVGGTVAYRGFHGWIDVTP